MEYTFIALPFFDKEDGQWKPSVKELCDGRFVNWTVWELGFDEPRFTLPYAKAFASEMALWRKKLAEEFLNNAASR